MQNQKFSIKTLLFFAGPLLGLCANAQENPPRMEDWLLAQIGQGNQIVCAQSSSLDKDTDWAVNRFFLNLTPSITVGIPGMLNLTVSPEIEFSWEKVELREAGK